MCRSFLVSDNLWFSTSKQNIYMDKVRVNGISNWRDLFAI